MSSFNCLLCYFRAKNNNYIKNTRRNLMLFQVFVMKLLQKSIYFYFIHSLYHLGFWRSLLLFFRTDAEKVVAGKVTLRSMSTLFVPTYCSRCDTEGEGSGKDHSFYERGLAISDLVKMWRLSTSGLSGWQLLDVLFTIWKCILTRILVSWLISIVK